MLVLEIDYKLVFTPFYSVMGVFRAAPFDYREIINKVEGGEP